MRSFPVSVAAASFLISEMKYHCFLLLQLHNMLAPRPATTLSTPSSGSAARVPIRSVYRDYDEFNKGSRPNFARASDWAAKLCGQT